MRSRIEHRAYMVMIGLLRLVLLLLVCVKEMGGGKSATKMLIEEVM